MFFANLEPRRLLSGVSFGPVNPISGSGTGDVIKTVVADVNGDGKPDLITTYASSQPYVRSTYLRVRLGNGNGTFGAPLGLSLGNIDPREVAAADVTEDGRADLIVSSSYGIEIFPGNGIGTFGNPTPLRIDYGGESGPQPVLLGADGVSEFALADLTGNGTTDIVCLSPIEEPVPALLV